MTGTSYPYILAALVELGIEIGDDDEFTFSEPSYEDMKYGIGQIKKDVEGITRKKDEKEKKKKLLEDYRDLIQSYDNLSKGEKLRI